MHLSIRARAASWLAVFSLAFAITFIPEAHAQLFHGASIQKNPVGPSGLPLAHEGDTIRAAMRVRNVDDFGDSLTITSIVDIVHHTSGSVTSANLLLAPVTLVNFGDSVTVTNTYPVLPGDPDVLQDDAQAGGVDNHDGENGSGLKQDFFITFPGQVRVLRPCIRVVKNCVNGIGENGTITWTGMVTNCGNTLLENVTVSNLVNGVMTLVFGPTNLPTNGFATFGGSYPANCAPVTDTLFARGTDELGLTVNNSASATCSNIVTAGIVITKNCPAQPVVTGGVLVFSGIVSNTGNVTLTNVVILNDQPAPGTPVTTIATLAPGQSIPYSGMYTTRVDSCGPWVDTVSVTARNGCSGAQVTASATATCPAFTVPGIAVAKICPPSPVQPGGVLTFTGFVTNTGNITLTNVVVVNSQPIAGTVVFGPTNLAPGAIAGFSASYTVPANACGPWIDTLTATARSICGSNVTNTATATCPAATTPSIQVTKTCPPGAVAPGGILTFTGTVTNNGNISLTNVIVVNNQPQAGTVVFGPISLAPGAGTNFSGSYTVPLNFCGPAVDTLTATATTVCGSNVTHSASASCPVITAPQIRVTKACPPQAVAPGGLLTFTGTVTNTGNISLTNVVVVNNQPQAGTVVFGPVSLAPGAGASFSASYTVPLDFCGPANDTLTVTSTSICGSNVSHTASASCPIITAPAIRVTKTCPPSPVVSGNTLVFTGTVTNIGNITLTNVIVVNDRPSAGTVIIGPLTLAPGAGTNFSGSYLTASNDCGPYIDTLTATASSICGSNVTNTATATCPGTTSPSIRVTKTCPPGAVAPGGLLTFTGTVTNNGNITLTNVIVVNDRPTAGTPVFGPITLLPGAGATFSGSYTVPLDFCGPAVDTLTASASSLCGSNVSHTATATCPIITAPQIRVTKACPPGPVAPGGLLTFTGTVTNTGNISLTNVVVVNNQPQAGTVVFGPVNLAPGAGASFSASYTVPLDFCGPAVDTLTASATSICGTNVSHSASASCPVITAPAIRVTKTCPPNPTQTGGLLVFTGTVTNIGNITLTNVIVVNDRPTAGTVVFGPITLAPGAGTNFTGSYTTPLGNCGPYVDTLTATATSICGSNVSNSATATCPGFALAGIVVRKFCPPTAVAPGALLTFTGSVSNSGDVIITNVVVVNNQPTPGTPVFGPTNLAPGQILFFTNTYRVPADACGPWIDTLTATATSLCGSNVSHTATATCASVVTPGIIVTKSCPPQAVAPGGLLTFTGTVTNTGNISLTNVIVVNNQPQAGTPVFGPITLAPGAGATFSGSYTVPLNFCGPANDTLTVTATTLCGSNISHQASASCPIVTAPQIRVTKSCPPPVAPGGVLVFSGTVTNTGNITLTNIVVVNSQPQAGTAVFGPITLAPGAGTNFTGSYVVPLNFCGPIADTLTVTATSICGSNVTHSATATCPIVTTPQILVAKFCPEVPVAPGGVLTFSGIVSNVGNITLTNVVVVNSQPTAGTVVFGPTNLAPGQSYFFSGSYNVPIGVCGPWIDTLTATATSICGSNVTHSATAQCPAAPVAGIVVTKTCVGEVGPGELLTFWGSVSNSGNVNLTNVVVVNDKPVAGTPVFGPTNLAPGQVFFFTNSYRVALDFCGPAVDTLTATATSVCGQAVSNNATASCAVITKPVLRLAKFCPPAPVAPGELLTFTGSISNAGNITITNIFVTNDRPTPGTPVVGPLTLSPGQVVFFTNSYRVPFDQCGPWVDTLSVTGRSICGTPALDSASATCPAIVTPQIRVAKFCPEGPVPPGGVLTFSGIVSNTGNITLTNVVVVNNQPTAGTVVFGPTNIAPGQVYFFSGSYTTPTNACGPWIDTLTVTARSICGEVVTHSASATCEALILPCVVVNKFCPPNATPPGGVLVYTGSVSNCGNITLTNIVVRNDRTPNAPVFGPTNLAPGQVYFFTNSYTVPLDTCGPVTDTLTVTGNTICGAGITNAVTTSCPIVTTPNIRVLKFCPPQPVAPGGLLVFTASVSNSGNITLTNVTVINNQPAPGTPVFGPVNLAPGQVVFFTNSYNTPTNACGPWVDTLTARARSICGVGVTNTATAICPAIVTTGIRVTKSCPQTPTGPNELLVFTGTVSNTGNVALINVVVVNNQPAPNTPVLGPITLQPGETRTFSGSYRTPFDVCGPYSDTLTARGTSICGVSVTNTATATCPGITTPRISITKSCPLTNTPINSLLVYSGVVSNSGNITLTNVIVVDNKPMPGTLVLGPTNLAPGQFIRFTNSYMIMDDCCGPYADMLTASGNDKCTGSNVVKTATAVCQALTLPELSLTRTCPTNPIVLGVPIPFSGIVSNSGTVVLSNVVVVGNDGEVIMSMQGFSVGEWMDYTATFTITNCPRSGIITNTITVTGHDICSGVQVSASATCILTCNGDVPPLVIINPTMTQEGFTLSFPSEKGNSYTIEYADTLNAPIDWETLTTVNGTGNLMVITDPMNQPHRFYRVICNPPTP